jgi:GNAT superfamily N-acetyltransferase
VIRPTDTGAIVRVVPAATLLPLRQRVLRPGKPLEACVFTGDEAPETRHYAALLADLPVAIASVYQAPCSVDPSPSDWQLRSMATAEELRGRGLGSCLLQACLDYARNREGRRLWCNARVPAAGFYLRHGFRRHGPEFLIPGVGPHYLMSREI